MDALDRVSKSGSPSARRGQQRIDAADAGRGLGQLVVALLDIVRQLLERQALRRVDSGSLSDEQIERLGQALQALEERFAELRETLEATDNRRESS